MPSPADAATLPPTQATNPSTSVGSPPRHEISLESPRQRLEAKALPLLKHFVAELGSRDEKLVLSDQIARHLNEFIDDHIGDHIGDHTSEAAAVASLRRLLRGCVLLLFAQDDAYIVLRPGVGLQSVVRLHPLSDRLERVSRDEFLQVMDASVQGTEYASQNGLVIDFAPFFREFPRVVEPQAMGSGISILNRHLAGQMYRGNGTFNLSLLEFLRNQKLQGQQILLNDYLTSPEMLRTELASLREELQEVSSEATYSEVAHLMRTRGFEAGWGCDVKTIRETLALLAQVTDSAEPTTFEALLGRMPLIRSVVMVSPHGWFAQDGVLGRPDTGGQVTYVLDQARAFERRINQQFAECGVDATPHVIILTRLLPDADGTTCNLPREKVHGSENSWIVRAPFRDEAGEILPSWISRFKIWPFLEQFAVESKQVVLTELVGRPDLIVGHYSDGNLVAHRLADDLEVTHGACVHALEKSKYLLSDLHWADMESDYHFSLQFTADLIAYNSADFILSSSFREVGGNEDGMGMIESYDTFSMPGLYRVRSGLDPRLARHNIVPPGASEDFFFPNTATSRRIEGVTQSLEERLLGAEPGEACIGELLDPSKPFVFAMARMDRIKNLSGLVDLFGKHPDLRNHANLLLVTSLNRAELSQDAEEIAEVNRAYELIEQHNLAGHFRWAAARLDKTETGEIYRLIADGNGVFAQPAFMETFGLTVIEAMACGTPVVVTCFGGPAEIVIDGESGFVANPNDHVAFGDALNRIVSDRDLWQKFSDGGIERVNDAFTWNRHAEKVMRLANVYEYWNHLDVMNRQALDQYIHTLYHTVYRPRLSTIQGGQ